MSSMETTKIIITIIAVILAAVHAWFPERISAITVMLLGIAALPWFGHLFKSIEIPGWVKLESRDFERIEEKAEKSGLVSTKEELKPMRRHIYTFQTVSGDDPNLALSGLRIEIESRLKKLVENKGIKSHGYGIMNFTRSLEQLGALSHDEAAAIRDLVPLLNKAVHGARIDVSTLGWVMDFGPRLLGALEDRSGESTIPNLIENFKRRDGAEGVEIGTQLSKAFVNSPEPFLSSMSEHPKEFQEWVNGLGHHTFTIFESRSELEDKLYLAYYGEFKALMIAATDSCKQSQYSDIALDIKSALDSVKIRRIQ